MPRGHGIIIKRLVSSVPKEVRGVVVTETRVGYNSCIRVWDTTRQRFWRPIRDAEASSFWMIGQWNVGQPVVITCEEGTRSNTKYPHATEDLFGNMTTEVQPSCRVWFIWFLLKLYTLNYAQAGALLTLNEIYALLNSFAKNIQNGGTDLGLSHFMYAEENEKNSSLFIVRTSSLSTVELDYADTLRFYNAQCGTNGVPVVAVDLLFNKGTTEVCKCAYVYEQDYMCCSWQAHYINLVTVGACWLLDSVLSRARLERKQSEPFPR